jgi:uncharacterized protein YbaA (DUF1428 family)
MAKSSKSKGSYIDAFVFPVPKRKINEYLNMARKAGKIWMEHGALEYRECQGEDLKINMGLPFLKLEKCKPNETVFFSWIVYRSKKHRNSVNANVMKDKRIASMMGKEMPFDMKRFSYGGFSIKVNL